jgi:hypothetical protein
MLKLAPLIITNIRIPSSISKSVGNLLGNGGYVAMKANTKAGFSGVVCCF